MSSSSYPRAQELQASSRFARADEEAASRLAAVKLSQSGGEDDTSSAASVVSPATPTAGGEQPSRAASSGRALPGVARDITAVIGNTPCIHLSPATTAGCVATVVAKLESCEPCCSVKDRIGVAMIDAAEKDGLIEPGVTTLVVRACVMDIAACLRVLTRAPYPLRCCRSRRAATPASRWPLWQLRAATSSC